jgi:glucose/mannose transport system permease protein
VVRRRSRRGVRNWLPGLILVTPSLLAVGIFVYYFIGWNVKVSLTDWRGSLKESNTFVGLKNYKYLLGDETFHNDSLHLLIFTVFFMLGALLLGIFMALLLDKGVRGEGVFRAVFLFPMAISFIATGVIWRWLLNSDTGAGTTGLNKLTESVGLGFLHSDWHKSDSVFAVASIALPATWALSGYVMALFLAGLRGIPEELREAARVDGASELRIYWHVIRPLLLPVLLSAVVILAHISLKTFDLIWAIDPRGPRTETPALYMWLTSFGGLFFSRGAAIATMLFIVIVAVVTPYIWYTMRQERRG